MLVLRQRSFSLPRFIHTVESFTRPSGVPTTKKPARRHHLAVTSFSTSKNGGWKIMAERKIASDPTQPFFSLFRLSFVRDGLSDGTGGKRILRCDEYIQIWGDRVNDW